MARTVTAEILAVGSELLTPFRTDTNSLFVTGRLNDLGFEVIAKSVVADRRDALVAAIRLACSRAEVVVTTGGLGPTDDDLTREAIAIVAGVEMVEDAAIVDTIARRFSRRGLVMPAINRRQALVPAGATVLDNPNGTAPGLWMPIADRIVVALPGPPRELQPMWDTLVVPKLSARDTGRVLRRRVIKIAGRGESHVDEVAAPIYQRWANEEPAIDTTILASPGQVELHLSVQGSASSMLEERLERAVCELADALGPAVFSIDGSELETVVGARLLASSATVAAAESCTGGLLLGRLTSVPGSSAWVTGGVVAYDNAVKVDHLQVPAELIATVGAVSEPVAVSMARGVRLALKSTYGVAITGIAGPSGGSDAKPVGTVVIAVAGSSGDPYVRTLQFPGDRAMVRALSVQTALDFLRRALDKDL